MDSILYFFFVFSLSLCAFKKYHLMIHLHFYQNYFVGIQSTHLNNYIVISTYKYKNMNIFRRNKDKFVENRARFLFPIHELTTSNLKSKMSYSVDRNDAVLGIVQLMVKKNYFETIPTMNDIFF